MPELVFSGTVLENRGMTLITRRFTKEQQVLAVASVSGTLALRSPMGRNNAEEMRIKSVRSHRACLTAAEAREEEEDEGEREGGRGEINNPEPLGESSAIIGHRQLTPALAKTAPELQWDEQQHKLALLRVLFRLTLTGAPAPESLSSSAQSCTYRPD